MPFIYFRNKKAIYKVTTTDDKRLQKRIGVNAIPTIEEVNIFIKDDVVTQFLKPKGNTNPYYLEYLYICDIIGYIFRFNF